MSIEDPGFNAEHEIIQRAADSEQVRLELEATKARFQEFLTQHGITITPEEEVTLISLASLRAMGEADGVSVRKDAERNLWDQGLLIEPWSDLVANEFDGEGLSDEELDEHLMGLAMRYMEREELDQNFTDTVDRYRQFLVEHGQEITSEDEILLRLFAHIKMVQGLRKSQQSYHEEALVKIIDSGRDSDAWRLLIDHEFLNWFED